MAVKHPTSADSTFSDAGRTAWQENHTVEDGSFVAAKLSATATDKLFGRSTAGAGNGEEITCTAAGRALLDDADAATQRATLGTVYTLQLFSPTHNPVDAQTVYFAAGSPANTTVDVYNIPVPVAGTIIGIYLEVGVGGTLGSTEQYTVSVRLNNTTDIAISAVVQANAARQQFNSGVISQAVSAGDRLQLKVVHPSFATNPTNVIYSAVVSIR